MRRFSFTDTIVLVNGVELTGWDEGDDVIAIARNTDSISHKIGADGTMMASISAYKSGTATFKLQQTSPANRYLSQLMDAQEASGSQFVPINFRFQDTYRQDMAAGTTGYLKRPSDMTRGAQAGTQEWAVVVERLDMLYGDVPPDASAIFGLSQ
jgi:hypothetical protein